MQIVSPRFIDISKSAREKLKDLGVVFYDDIPGDEQTIIQRIKNAEVVIGKCAMPKAVIDVAPNLKYIIVPAVGYEWIDTQYAASKGVQVLNCPTYNSNAVAEHAIALLFALKHHIVEASQSMKLGNWHHPPTKGVESQGKVIGIIGYGRIGKRVGEMAKGLGMNVAFANSSSSPADIDAILQKADFVCLCLPLNDKTRNLLDERRIGLLQPHAMLINVGRGATIDQTALLKALKTKRIAGAGLDVFSTDPRSGEPGQEVLALANLPNVVATPHMAYQTQETVERLGEELLENIQACLAGKPKNVVGPR